MEVYQTNFPAAKPRCSSCFSTLQSRSSSASFRGEALPIQESRIGFRAVLFHWCCVQKELLHLSGEERSPQTEPLTAQGLGTMGACAIIEEFSCFNC
eukprot:scaffold68_cov340-Pavlova_lutheri.AAC.42